MFNVKSISHEYSKEKVAKVHQLDSSHASVHTHAHTSPNSVKILMKSESAKFCKILSAHSSYGKHEITMFTLSDN